ncbi:MAG: M48 family metallopeptidase [Bacteroidota bacterium]
MASNLILIILISILVVQFVWDMGLDILNIKHWKKEVPAELIDIVDREKYQTSRNYQLDNFKISFWMELISLPLTILVLSCGVLAMLDSYIRIYFENEVLIGLLFFGVIGLASDIIKTPIEWYQTFVIEEKYGFNKMTKKLFVLDKIKGLLLSIIIGGIVLGLILLIYQKFGTGFWIWAWLLVSFLMLFFSMFYSDIIVPLFNKQTPLEEGELRERINELAVKLGFKVKNIFVIDGSKRSTKANAYFSGFGPRKRIVLYDTLIQDHTTEELLAVLSHEIGHYKKRHVIYMTVMSLIQSAFVFFLLSVITKYPIFVEAIGVEPSVAAKGVFHIQLLVFGLLISPMFEFIGVFGNVISRKFEYQADNYAVKANLGEALISALKKMSVKHLSNLLPHPLYVFANYSHPPLLERMGNIRGSDTGNKKFGE